MRIQVKTFRMNINACGILLLATIAFLVSCVNVSRTNVNDGCYGKENEKGSDTCASATTTATTSTTVLPQKYIFLTTTAYNGNLGGISGADAKCNADAAKPNPSTYKAHIYHGTGTIGGDTSNLSTSYDYKNTSNAKTISGGSGISSGIPIFNLINPISATSVSVWFGNSTDNCTNWSSASSLVNAGIGGSNDQNSLYRASGTQACNNLFRIYCIEN